MMKQIFPSLIILVSISNSVFAINTSQFFSKNYAIVIGIKNYSDNNWPDLKYAENDAIEMEKYFKKEGYEVKSFISEKATKSNIVSYLEDFLPNKLNENDRLVIYFSGHGDTYKDTGRGYLIPHDGVIDKPSSWISMKQLLYLSSVNEKAKHQLFILDACFGGALATKSSKGEKQYVEAHTQNIARQFLAAGLENQTTLAESRLPGYKQFSHYTAYLIKGLRDGYADTYRDGIITHNELSSYLEGAAITANNTPIGGVLAGHELGSFVFSSPLSEPENSPIIPTIVGPTKSSSQDQDKYDWELYSGIGTKEALLSYKERHPSGKYVDRANASIKRAEDEEKLRNPGPTYPEPEKSNITRKSTLTSSDKALAIQVWNQDIQFSTDPKVIEEYLSKFPNGPMTTQAERKLGRLKR